MMNDPIATQNGPHETKVWLAATLAFIAVFAAASLPMLSRVEFVNSIENIVIETALETRRGGHWLVPRMLDEPRTRKPPLATWASAAFVRRDTLRRLADPATRDAGYARLAREMRLAALIAACLTILATFELGRTLVNPRVGAIAAVMAGTSLLFFEYARLATPDTHLMLWVAACNLCLVHAALGKRRWLACCAAGACLGLAFLSKGPVALLQTVVPYALFLLPTRRRRGWAMPALAGTLLFLAVALPWPLLMLAKTPGVWETWFGEVTRLNAADPRPDRWYANLQFLRHMLPWTPWLIAGAIVAAASVRRKRRAPIELAFWLVVVPLVVMSFFPERKPRYLLPLVPAAAVLSAVAMAQMWVMRRALSVSLLVVCATGMFVIDFVRTSRAAGSDMKPLADAMRHLPPDARVWSLWRSDPTNNAPIDLSIYLNRVVAPAPSLDAALSDPACRAVVVASGARRPIPPWPAPGAVHLGSGNRGDAHWHAFELLPRDAP